MGMQVFLHIFLLHQLLVLPPKSVVVASIDANDVDYDDIQGKTIKTLRPWSYVRMIQASVNKAWDQNLCTRQARDQGVAMKTVYFSCVFKSTFYKYTSIYSILLAVD